MHWLLLIGGQAYWGGGQVVNRASLHHCSSLQLEDTINRSFNNIYGVINGYAPPMPHLHTYALGLQVQHQCSIEKEVLPEMHRRMKRLDVSYYHENFYEDSAEGFGNVNLLSREQCMAWLQHIADHLMDCEDFDENEVVLYEFPNRPEGFSKEALPEAPKPWKRATMNTATNGAPREVSLGVKSPAVKVPPAHQAGSAANPKKRLQAADAGNGAGPSNVRNVDKDIPDPDSLFKSLIELKVAGIKAALQYNGYPPSVIEDLLKKVRTNMVKDSKNERITCKWRLLLPNGKIAESYAHIDANPFPGGKIIKKTQRKCHISHCTRPFAHTGQCVLAQEIQLYYEGTEHATSRPAVNQPLATLTALNDGAVPGRRDNPQNLDNEDDLLGKLTHVTAGVRAALYYAGYPPDLLEQMMKDKFHVSPRFDWKAGKYYWSLRLPDGKLVTAYNAVMKNPCPEGTVTDNPICHTLGCGRNFGHKGSCSVALSDRCRVRPEFDPGPVSFPSRKRARAHSPSPLSNLPPQTKQKISFGPSPQQIELAITKKKKSLLKVLVQSRYPTAVAEKLLEDTIFKTSGLDKRGNILLKFHMKLPTGSSASNESGIMLNPYSLGGGGFFASGNDLQGLFQKQRKKQVQGEMVSVEESSLISTSSTSSSTSSSSRDEDPPEEEREEIEGDKEIEVEEEERSHTKSLSVCLPTTEEEDNVDLQGEVSYSNEE